MSLCRLLKIAEHIDSGDRDWFLNAIDSWKAGDQLDVAFGLCGAAAITRRNMALKSAANILNINDEYSTWHVAFLLERAVSRFESRILTRYRKNKKIKLSDIDALLVEMFQPRCRVVRKQRQIFDCIK